MAGNTKCYRVTVGEDGALVATMVDFSPRFADNLDNALMRLRQRDILQPPHVKFGDWPALLEAWAAGRGA